MSQQKLEDKLRTDRNARAKFLADAETMLKNQGVDVNDPNVKKVLDLDLDDGDKFVKQMKASTIIITNIF